MSIELCVFILTILLGIRQFITSCRIDKLDDRIEELEKKQVHSKMTMDEAENEVKK